MANVLVFAEQREGVLRRAAHEAAGAARRVADALGGSVDAVVLGPASAAGWAAELGRSGVDRVLVGAGDLFESHDPEAFTAALERVVRAGDHYAVLLPATSLGKDLAPRLAARLGVPLATDATALQIEDGELVITRPVYAGKAVAEVVLDAAPRVVSLRPNVFRAAEAPREAAIESIDLAGITPGRVRVREFVEAAGERPDVAEAAIIVSGGRGLRGPENWQLLEQLAEALGPQCALGASRAVVDAGWRPHGEQVGQTGKTVSPQLYFAVGISGAIQHLAGMRTARTIVAINKDPEAPIFKVADYGVVGDALDILPRLAEAIREARAGG